MINDCTNPGAEGDEQAVIRRARRTTERRETMCFSAGSSFTAGVLLTFAGVETMRKVHKPAQLGLASISLFFAFQQVAEGFLWVSIGKSDYAVMQAVSTYLFIIMAQVVWPILVPLSVLLMEENRTRKKILFALQMLGVAIALYYAYRLIFYDISAEISRKHIVYPTTAPHYSDAITVLFYLVATIAPLFVSSVKRIHFVGTLMGLSFVVSAVLYREFLISVWCFFAAVISFVLFYIIRESHKKHHAAQTGSR